MSWSVTLAGQTFTEANVEGTAYADEQTGFPAILAAIAEETRFLKGLGATASTVLTPQVGTAVLATDQPFGQASIPLGALVQIRSQSDPGSYMIGTVVSFVGTALTIAVSIAAGGEASDWVIGMPNPALNELMQDLTVNGFAIVSRDNGDIAITPDGTGLATLKNLNATGPAVFAGPVRVDAGGQLLGHNMGALNGTIEIDSTIPQFAYGTITGDCVLAFDPPSLPGYGYGVLFKITQDATGGRSVAVQSNDGILQGTALGDPVDWALRGPGAWNYLSVFWTPAGDLLLSNLGGS
ncbi:MAG: hypothetical protein NXI19_20085 [Alphaproteobacteria bacterium]|nr:hypothetical protein [Alphaproteobacteria bacterium]